jgi:predicted dehydrogenase
MKTINWGIIGCGNIANKFIKALKTFDNAKLMGVASKSGDNAKQYAKKYDVPYFYNNYNDLALNPEIDVVYIANSHNFHKESAMICINNGKAVLCEKSLTVNAAEAIQLVNAARSKQVFLMEAMWSRFQPVTRKVMELIEKKIIGDIRLLTVGFGFKANYDEGNRLFNPRLAGGALLDVGIYPVSLASLIFGKKPTEIKSNAVIGTTGVDESSSYFFTYDNGETALLNSSLTYKNSQLATIIGTKGIIQIPSFWMAEKLIVEIENKNPVTYDYPLRCNGYEYEIEEVMQCLREGKTESSIMPLDESLDIMQTMDQLRSQWNLKYPGE